MRRSGRLQVLIRRVSTLVLVVVALLALAAMFALESHGGEKRDFLRTMISVGVFAGAAVAIVLVRIDRMALATLVMNGALFGSVAWYALGSGFGVHSFTYALFIMAILIGGLVLGPSTAAGSTLGAILTVSTIYWLVDAPGFVDPATFSHIPAWNVLILYVTLFLGAGVTVALFSKVFRRMLSDAEDQEARLRSLIEVNPLGHVVHRDGRILMANRAARAFMVGGEIEGRSITDLVPQADLDAAYAHVKDARTLGAGQIIRGEVKVPDRSGRDHLFEILTTPFSLVDKVAYVTVFRDITLERVAAQAMAQEKAAAESANQQKSRFLANMSHEIRTPLSGVLGMAEVLLSTPLSDAQKRYCTSIVLSGRTLQGLLGDVLDLSKIEAGEIDLEHTAFDVADVIEELSTTYRQLASSRGTLFTAHGPDRSVRRLIGDPFRLRQVLGNLLSNAVKFAAGGDVRLTVESMPAVADDPRQWLRFIVSDSGIGMSDEEQGRLFQPFVQADASTTRRYGGTGLGLTICRHLVTLMGGRIGLRSESGRGTEFRVEIPFGLAPEASGPEVGAAKPDSARAVAPMRILLVEDNALNQDVACAMLRGAGHQVMVAEDGAVAVERARAEPPDCILMDCHMPVMDGLEATRRIRADEAAGQRVPIIALTANALRGEREKCFAAGMDDFLSKPFTRADLLACVARYGNAAPAAEAVASTPHYDAGAFAELAALDRETPGFLQRLVGRFRSETPKVIERLAAAGPETLREAERAAHSLKSTSARFGAMRLSALCAEAELAAREGRVSALAGHADAMRVAFAEVDAQLAAQMERDGRLTGAREPGG